MSLFKDKSLKKCHTDNRKMIDDIHEEMISDMNPEDITSYYLKNGLLLDKYYRTDTETRQCTTGILSYLSNEPNKTEPSTIDTKKELLGKLMENIDDNILTMNTDVVYDRCKMEGCGGSMKMSQIEGTFQCPKCGYTEDIIVESEKGSYNDPPNESNYFAYKRINHFNEWLSQFQAKATTDIPDNIYIDVHRELKKDIYLDWETLSYARVRETLKKLKYNKYYEHIPHIINILSGKNAPNLDRKIEDTLRSLFKDIQKPFMTHCPPTRKNFLSYSYVLYKFCELLEYDELLIFFPLLKSREKLQQQDMIWEKICNELQWQYIPST